MPTGGGKTIVFANIVGRRLVKGKCLVLAHREELIDQAIHKLHAATGIFASKEKAEHHASLHSQVVVASIQTLMGARKERWGAEAFDTIIVDEAHHALADSYRSILDYFSRAKILGVTATPDRGDKKNLGSFFEEIAFETGLLELINEGYLSKIVCKTIPFRIDLTKVRKTAGDFNAGDLGSAIEPVLEFAITEMLLHAANRKTLVFLPLISTAKKFSDIARARGVNCDFVSGECVDRAEKLDAFRNGKIQWLTNSMLLTEGYDDPSIDCVVVLRPTQSRALYSQMVGRGTRTCEGKDNLLILDFLWHVEKHSLVKAAHLVAGNEEEAEEITKILEAGGGAKQLDLLEVKSSAQNAREESLRKAIEKQAKKKSNQVDPVEFALNLHAQALIDFEPTMPWHSHPISPKQRDTIEQFGISAGDMRKGHASALLDAIFSRRKMGLATPKQLNWLIRKNHPSPHTCSFEDASVFLDGSFSGVIRNTREATKRYHIPAIGEAF